MTAAARKEPAGAPYADWTVPICEAFDSERIGAVAYVPDTPLGKLVRIVEERHKIQVITATREEEAVGIAAGLSIGGARPVAMMQTSGLGNSLNALASLVIPYQIPMLLLICERGGPGEWNIAQVPGGVMVEPTLRSLGIQVWRLEDASKVGLQVIGAAQLAFETRYPVAVVLSKTLTGW